MSSGFLTARRLDEALDALASPGAVILAGGTDLMVALRRVWRTGEAPPGRLVDVTRLGELTRLELDGPRPYVGAGVTLGRLAEDAAVRRRLPLLAQAAGLVGSAQVRQAATIGGNAANASPAADGVTALMALAARAEVASMSGRRWVALGDLIAAPNRNTLAPGELILGFELAPPTARHAQSFLKVGRRRAVTIARLNLAVCLDRELDDPRLCLGACFPSPRRLDRVEALLAHGRPGPDLWAEAGQAAAAQFADACGGRSSAAYKCPAVDRVVTRTLARTFAEVSR